MVAVTSKYQVTIPKQVREKLGIVAGAEVVFVRFADGYKLVKAEDVIDKGVDVFSDIGKTVKEVKKSLGKGCR